MANQQDPKGRLNKTTAKGKYPYVQTWLTESGHEMTFDNTPGNRRIRIAHGKSGTYMEISENGKMVTHVTGNRQDKTKGGVTLTVDENNDVKIHGHQRILTGGGSHIETKGDAAITVGGDSMSVVMGNQNSAVAGDAYTGVKGNMKMNVGGNMAMEVAGDIGIKAGGSVTTESGGNNTTKAPQIHHN